MSDKMSTIKGIDCFGKDLVHYEIGTNGINSEEDCNNKCLETDGCNAASYTVNNGGKGYCRLKSNLTSFKKNNQRNCSYKNGPIVVLPSLDLPDNDIKYYKNTSPEECLDYCRNNAECDTMVHAPNSNECWLKQKYDNGKYINNYTINSDRNTTLVRPFTGKGSGSDIYEGSKEDYAKYEEELRTYKDAALVKSVMERNRTRLGSMNGDSTLKQNALDVYKQKLMRQNQQQQTQQTATANSNNMSKQLSSAYDELIDDNIDGINQLDNAIETRRYLINENNKGAYEKNKSIYILSYFLLLMLLIAVIFLCTFLGIISSRIAMGLTIVASLFFIFKVIYKYYWNGVDSESVALKKMIYTGYKDVGENIRDAVLPKWAYSCPKRCKAKKPDHMRPHPRDGKLYTDAPDLRTDSSENVWSQGIKSPTTYNCKWQGPSEEIESSKQCISGSTIPCDEYLGYAEVDSCSN